MRVAIFSTKAYDRTFLEAANGQHALDLTFFEAALDEKTAALAEAFPAICPFVNDRLNRSVLETLAGYGVQMVSLRSAGFNNVDVPTAERLGITVARVPAYSPHAVAEHTVGLMLALSRRLHRAFNRVRELNFSLDGLLGWDFHGRTAGVVGTGTIGTCVARILHGFGCKLLGHDVRENPECRALGMRYVGVEELAEQSDVITLHCPLTPVTRHLFGRSLFARVKPGVMLINTSRGAVIDTRAAIEALKSRRLGGLGIDVYEEEADLFFRDLSGEVVQDDVFARLLTFPNVVITAHQAFFTSDALHNIAETTLGNIDAFRRGELPARNRVTSELVR